MLAYHLGISWETYYSWPVPYKRWFLERLQKEMKAKAEAGDIPSKATQYNSPDARAFTQKTRTDSVPHKLRRFT